MFREILHGLKAVYAQGARRFTSTIAKTAETHESPFLQPIPPEGVRQPRVENQAAPIQRDPLLLAAANRHGNCWY